MSPRRRPILRNFSSVGKINLTMPPANLLITVALFTLWTRSSQGIQEVDDLFQNNDEYRFSVLDPNSVYGSPFGGYSRATASRLAGLPLRLRNLGEEADATETPHTTVRDALGRRYICKVYTEEYLEPSSLTDSMFHLPVIVKDDGGSNDGGEKGNSKRNSSSNESVGINALDRVGEKETQQQEEDDDGSKATASSGSVPKDLESERSVSTSAETEKSPQQQVDEVLQRLERLMGMCAQLHQGWWSYEWCYQAQVTQFHVSIQKASNQPQEIMLEDVTSLGSFSKRQIQVVGDRGESKTSDGSSEVPLHASLSDGMVELARVQDFHTAGDVCELTGKPRVTEVTLRCCSSQVMARSKGSVLLNGIPHATDLLAIQGALESKNHVCVYDVTVCTPLLCADTDNSLPEQPKAKVTLEQSKTRVIERKSGSAAVDIDSMSVLEVLEMTFGGTKKKCIQSGTGGWWVYELCPGKHVRQFHEVTLMDRITGTASTSLDTDHILGKYFAVDHEKVRKEEEWKHISGGSNARKSSGHKNAGNGEPSDSNTVYYVQEYTKGDVCDNEDVTDSAIKAGEIGEGRIERATTVRYACGNVMEMNVKEDTTCHYIVDVTIPALCGHPLFKAPVSNKQVVKCLVAP